MSSPRKRPARRPAAREQLFVNAAEVVTCAGAPGPRRGADMARLEVLKDGAVAVQGDRIVAVGPRRELLRRFAKAKRVDCDGGVLTPALVDSHTHAVFGAPRAAEHE